MIWDSLVLNNRVQNVIMRWLLRNLQRQVLRILLQESYASKDMGRMIQIEPSSCFAWTLMCLDSADMSITSLLCRHLPFVLQNTALEVLSFLASRFLLFPWGHCSWTIVASLQAVVDLESNRSNSLVSGQLSTSFISKDTSYWVDALVHTNHHRYGFSASATACSGSFCLHIDLLASVLLLPAINNNDFFLSSFNEETST